MECDLIMSRIDNNQVVASSIIKLLPASNGHQLSLIDRATKQTAVRKQFLFAFDCLTGFYDALVLNKHKEIQKKIWQLHWTQIRYTRREERKKDWMYIDVEYEIYSSFIARSISIYLYIYIYKLGKKHLLISNPIFAITYLLTLSIR